MSDVTQLQMPTVEQIDGIAKVLVLIGQYKTLFYLALIIVGMISAYFIIRVILDFIESKNDRKIKEDTLVALGKNEKLLEKVYQLLIVRRL